MSSDSGYLRWNTQVQALGRSWTVRKLGKSKHCFVHWETFWQRMRSLGPNPDPVDVEAALCFTRALWTHYSEHGCLTQDHLDLLDIHDTASASEDPGAKGLTARIRLLPPRQKEVLVYLLHNWPLETIAERTSLAPSSVSYYRSTIKRRLAVRSYDDPVWQDPAVADAVKDITAESEHHQ